MATQKGPKLKTGPFEVHGSRLDLGKRWQKWLTRFERELKYSGVKLTTDSEIAQMALLIYVGTEAEEIHDSLPEPVKPETVADAQWTEYSKSVSKLSSYFLPQQSNDFAVFEMMNTKPLSGETTKCYATRLREAADKCDFTQWSAEKMIKCILILNLQDEELRMSCLQKVYTLQHIIDKATRKEDATEMHKKILGKDTVVNKVGWKERKDTPPSKNNSQVAWSGTSSSSNNGSKCRNCGGDRHTVLKECPAQGKPCNYCRKPGHFAKVCFKLSNKQAADNPAVKVIQENRDSDTDSEDSVDKVEERDVVHSVSSRKIPLVRVSTGGVDVVWQPDTAASRDIWSPIQLSQYEKTLNRKMELHQSKVQLYAYGAQQPLKLKGSFKTTLSAGTKTVKTDIIVTEEDSKYPLMSETTARELDLISYNPNYMVNAIGNAHRRREVQAIIDESKEVFSGKIGKAKQTVQIMINPEMNPVAQRGRKIPYNLQSKAEEKLQQLLQEDIIEPVPHDEPKTWVSCPVIALKPKSDQIRFCVDMRLANKAICRPNAMLPTTEDVLDKFEGATTFSKLDLKEAYHQFELSPECRHITTFHGPDKLYRYKRLNYGTRSAQDVLQNEMSRILAGIPNQVNVADDILIGGSQKQHDKALEQVVLALKTNGITANPQKCQFDTDCISFLGLVFSSKGIKPDMEKISDLRHAAKPQTKEEVRSFLGMSGFNRGFVKNYAQLTAPLRVAAKDWVWEPEQDEAFEKLRTILDENTLLHPYRVGAETQLIVDASPDGLGAVLAQKQKDDWVPVVYKSRSLKDPESRYSQTEREGLAIRWGVQKLRKFLLGAPRFKIITDHKPLQYMFNKGTRDMPPRIERFVMDIQGYDWTVEYRPGINNAADYLSRHPSPRKGSSRTEEVEDYANKATECHFVNVMDQLEAVTRDEVKAETLICPEMMLLRDAIRTGDFKNQGLERYATPEVRGQLHTTDDIIYRGSRIIVPQSLRDKVVKISHRGHQGCAKAKALIREFCWFPGIDRMVETKVQNCRPCQAVVAVGQKPPVKPHTLPPGPWQEIEMDFQGPYPAGQYIFAMIDRYSKWVEIAVFRQPPDAKTTIQAMTRIFDSQGIPGTCQSDNGQPFASEEMRQFARKEGFRLKHITPEWPRANGEVERFNKTMKEAVQKGVIENRTFTESVQRFLRMYRATPHSTTEVSPFEAMYSRKMSVGLPRCEEKSSVVNRHLVEKKQEKMADRQGGKEHKLSPGDTVLVQQRKRNKLTPRYEPESYTVTDVRGSMVTAEGDRRSITRDGSIFKQIPADFEEDEEEEPSPDQEVDGVVPVDDDPADPVLEDHVAQPIPAPEQEARRSHRERRKPARLASYEL